MKIRFLLLGFQLVGRERLLMEEGGGVVIFSWDLGDRSWNSRGGGVSGEDNKIGNINMS